MSRALSLRRLRRLSAGVMLAAEKVEMTYKLIG